MKQIKVILKPAQQKLIDKLIKDKKFTRLSDAILKDKSLSVDSKARYILDLKYKMYGRK